MYRGYDLKIVDSDLGGGLRDNLSVIGQSVYDEHTRKIKRDLGKFLSPDGTVDGSKMQEAWFQDIKADIFLSHSHKNEPIAIMLAGLFKGVLGLSTFIDSCIWGYSLDLLREIDNKFCKRENGNYDYDKRNYSTSHVHMMLASALSKTIDNCECLLFLNTPESVNADNVIHKTSSPWIYYEIAITNTIRQHNPRQKITTKAFGMDEGMRKIGGLPDFLYDLQNANLQQIDMKYLTNRIDLSMKNKKEHSLDVLYGLG